VRNPWTNGLVAAALALAGAACSAGDPGIEPTVGRASSSLRAGSSISLMCEGQIPGPRWLDGRTADSAVDLAPSTAYPATGTRWKVYDLGDGAIALECQGEIPGPRWLNGRTGDGTVDLASSTAYPATGTRWGVQ
jgi:hypothetical protein